MKEHTFYHSCVGWPRREVQQLVDMIDSALTISRRTFLKHVNREELNDIETNLSYSRHYKQGLTMAGELSRQLPPFKIKRASSLFLQALRNRVRL